ncbi:MAG: crossover junction endodeoxyribonuclease RuvC [Pseudomonadota bacterium]
MMRVLGIDPGSRATGYGVIQSHRQTSTYLASGCIRTESKDFPARLGEIFSQLSAVITETRPEQVAVEQVFVAKNANAALKLGQARGAAITAAVTQQLPVFEYSARSVKQALVGTGAADKTQVQHMVQLMLGQQRQMGLDESDALAVALCHAHHQHFFSRVNQA